jgi:hypothetical protein
MVFSVGETSFDGFSEKVEQPIPGRSILITLYKLKIENNLNVRATVGIKN